MARTVDGRVVFPDGRPAAERRVVAYSIALRREAQLGDAVTAEDGHYGITYATDGRTGREAIATALRVAVVDPSGQELATSSEIFQPSAHETVDVTLPLASDERSELERNLAALEAPLEGHRIEDVRDEELRFLAGVTQIPADQIAAIAEATRRASGDGGGDSKLPREAWYGWFREGVVAPRDGLEGRSTDDLVEALNAAIAARIVPTTVADRLDGLAEAIERRRLDDRLRVRPAAAGGLGALLDTLPTPLSDDHRRSVAAVVADGPAHADLAPRLQAAGLTHERAAQVVTTLRLGDLTLGHTQLVSELQPILATEGGTSLQPLAKLASDEWLDLAYRAGVPTDSSLDQVAYARTLNAGLEALEPTASLAARLEDGTVTVDLPGSTELPSFLREHPELDVVETDVQEFVPESADNRGELVGTLKALQRVKRLGATWEEAASLIQAGADSAANVVSKGRSLLQDALGDRIASNRIDELVAEAHDQHDTALAVLAASPTFTGTTATALPPPTIDTSPLAGSPTLESLFGSLDTCACRHCRSVLSPAAYFVDLFELLRQTAPSAFTELTARRPDLVDLDLSCENTEQELPCIDLVLEILENAVALPLVVTLPPGTDAEATLGGPKLPPVVLQALRRTAVELADDLKAEKEPHQLLWLGVTQWTVKDGHRRWALSHFEDSLLVTPSGSFIKRPVSLRGLDAAALVDNLDAGTVTERAAARLAEVLLPASERRLASRFDVTVLEQGKRWRIAYSVRGQVKIESGGERPTLEVATVNDDLVRTSSYSQAAIQATETALRSGRTGGLLEELVSRREFTVEPDGAGGTWKIESETLEADLEYVSEKLSISALSFQSSRHADERRVFPENRSPAAYERLRDGEYPWSLPFDLPLEEIRALLERARVSRLALMESMRASTRLGDLDVARERLLLSAHEADLIASAAAPPNLWERWGFRGSTIFDASLGEARTGTPEQLVGSVSVLLQQAGLGYGELLDVLETRFVRGARTIAITPPTSCRPSEMQLSGADAACYDRLHRFVRLRRALGWNAYEVDLVVDALGASSDIAPATLVGLSHVERLRQLLDVPLDEIASWWGGLGQPVYHAHTVTGEPVLDPLYDRLFLQPSVRNPPDPDLAPAPSRTELAVEAGPGPPPNLSDKLAAVAASLGATETEVASAVSALGLANALTLENLSALHRVFSIARGLGLSIDDFFRLCTVAGIDPFSGTTPAVEFCDAAALVREVGFSVAELAYLLRDDGQPGLEIMLSDEAAADIVDAVRAALVAAETGDAAAAPQPPVDAVVAIVAQALRLDLELARDLLTKRVSHPADPGRPAIDALLDAQLAASTATPLRPVDFPAAFGLLRRLNKASALLARLGVDRRAVGWVAARGEDGMSALQLDALPWEPQAPNAPSLFEPFQQLVTLYRLRRRGRGASAMLARYVAALTAPGSADAQRIAAAVQELAAGLAVAPALVEDAAAQLGLVQRADFADPINLERLLDLVLVLEKLGASIEQATALTAATPDFEGAATARALLRSRYGAADWANALQPVSDSLRRRQRDALVAYLAAGKPDGDVVTSKPVQTADELYERYLMDVLIGPCATTTRLLQAISAIQLFVERCLLGLEPQVPAAGIDRKRWEWTKNYRVWEANRKVFLYPENWLTPEFLDNKTETLRELEAALDQSEPTHQIARTGLLVYLDALAQLAQIAILGMYEDVPKSNGSVRKGHATLYVVGRSMNEPYEYFWRKCERFCEPGMHWTGWERVDLDITGTHVIPFVFEGDFHIAWTIIRRVQTPAPEHWEVQLAWARRTTSGWTQKKVSRDVLSANVVEGHDERTTFTFRTELIDSPPPSAVAIQCYALSPPRPRPEYHPWGDTPPTPAIGAADLDIICRVLLEMPTAAGISYWDRIAGVEVRLGRRPLGETGADDLVRMLPKTDDWGGISQARLFRSDPDLVDPGDNPLEFEYIVSVTYGGQMKQKVASLDPTQGVDWRPEFIFTAPPPPPADAMFPAGRFVLRSNDDVRWTISSVPYLMPPANARFQDDGFIEDVGKGSGTFALDVVIGQGSGTPAFPEASMTVTFAGTPGRFLAIPTGPETPQPSHHDDSHIWHYDDDANRLYLDLRPPESAGTWLAVADGHAAATLLRSTAAGSLDDLFSPALQAATDHGQTLVQTNKPTPAPGVDSFAEQGVTFDLRAAYSIYNWELFLHAPLLVADRLSRAHRFEDARRWLHFVFDPTTSDSEAPPARYWQCLPLRRVARGDSIQQLVTWLSDPEVDDGAKKGFLDQVELWRENPFRPYAVARMRNSAYQWCVLFTYLSNLLDWGDQLFSRDTREAIDEAVLLYVLAARLLGPRPRSIRPRVEAPTLTYRGVAGRWDELSNMWVTLVDRPVRKAWNRPAAKARTNGSFQLDDVDTSVLTSIGVSYFCVPPNDKLEEYWNRVEDRLFKIRHCQNIEGIARDLALWDPPIDPELLVRAVAAGVDIGEAVAGLAIPLPHYRFSVLVQKANELCGELKNLGASMLSALEKKDAEALAQLRSGQEAELLQLVRQVREKQLEEAHGNVDSLRASRKLAAARYRHYQRLLGKPAAVEPAEGQPGVEEQGSLVFVRDAALADKERGLGMIQSEQDQLAELARAQVASGLGALSSIFSSAAFFTAMRRDSKDWAEPLGHALGSMASSSSAVSTYFSEWAGRDVLLAGYQRRKDEWIFQSNLALRELAQIDGQIAAANIRAAIADRELSNHDRQTENARAVDAFMRDKFTNEQLYSFMSGRLASVFFATYQVALETARKAERALVFELGLQKSSFVRPGYWDSLKKGLLAGEHLSYDLKRMELAYLDQNRREYELTKHISLRQLDPLALIELKQTGSCDFKLREGLFDLDFPAYMRRIKLVALSIPSVVGPYTSVNCRLALTESSVRVSAELLGGTRYLRDTGADDPRFKEDVGLVQSIVTSTAVNDSGLFETSLRDERYLPFEGAGVIGAWRLELRTPLRQFDYDTISDVILHLRYTARDGGDDFAGAATAEVQKALADAKGEPQGRLVSLRHEFPSQWARLTATGAGPQRSEKIPIPKETFPFLFQDSTVTIVRLDLLAEAKTGANAADLALPTVSRPAVGSAPAQSLALQAGAEIGDLLHGIADQLKIEVGETADWTIAADETTAEALGDLFLVLTYTVK